MARCVRCNKFMLIRSQTGYCSDCSNAVVLEDRRRREEERKAEEIRRAKEIEADRLRRAEEELQRKIEEERHQREMEELRRIREEEKQRKAAEYKILYDKAVELMNSAVGLYKIEEAIKIFSDLGDYLDSEQKLTDCLKKRASIQEDRRQKAEKKRKEKDLERAQQQTSIPQMSKKKQTVPVQLSENEARTEEATDTKNPNKLVFSYSNWDIALGHLPFLQSTSELLYNQDGEEVVTLGNQYMLKSMNPMTSLDSFCVKHYGDSDYTVPQIQNSKDLITEIVVARRKQLLPVPYSFWTPAIVYTDNEFGFAMVSLSETEQWSFTMRSRTSIPSYEAMQSIATLMRIEGRIFADGMLDSDENVQVFLLSIDQMERLANIALSPQMNSSRIHIDVQSAKKYFEQLFGYMDEDEYHALESKYEQECSLFISAFEADKLISKIPSSAMNTSESEKREKTNTTVANPTPASEPVFKKTGSFHTKVVGVTFKNDDGSDRQRIIRDLNKSGLLSEGTELDLIPQPDNPYDSNCIRVVAKNGQQIGCLSRDVAAKVAPMMKQGVVYKAFVTVQTGGDVGFAYGVNIRIETYEKEEATISTSGSPTVKTSAPPSCDDYEYSDNDDMDYYDYEQMQREAWNETHLNPYGTEDCGDGYIDSDGVFTEY